MFPPCFSDWLCIDLLFYFTCLLCLSWFICLSILILFVSEYIMQWEYAQNIVHNQLVSFSGPLSSIILVMFFSWLLRSELFRFCHSVQSCWLDFAFYLLLFDCPSPSLFRHIIIFWVVALIAQLLHVLCMSLSCLILLFCVLMCIFVFRVMFSLYVVYNYFPSDLCSLELTIK